jgi:tRNA(Ile2) C34 agmatinyltransferase TiaS
VSDTATATHSPELTIDATTERSAMRLFEAPGLTLEDVVLGAWEDLVAGGPAECPVCGGSMRAAGGCESCGSDLS